jgi:predicted nucleotidyltransferase
MKDMLTLEDIKAYSDEIVKKFDPDKIILFGSYAYGTPHVGSDVDMLVIMAHEGNSIRKSVEIIYATNPRFGIDLLIRTPASLEKRLNMGDTFIRDILTKGKTLYERTYQ